MSALPEADSKTMPPLAPARPPGRSVLAADLRITGDIVAEGAVEVMGEIDGSIRAKSFLVAQDGRMTGTVTADSVEVRGHLQGAIACSTLTLRSAAHVKADIVYTSVAIESGAEIDGTFKKPKS
jgi:cytoskeletal protein CcmA (bactofilin family)